MQFAHGVDNNAALNGGGEGGELSTWKMHYYVHVSQLLLSKIVGLPTVNNLSYYRGRNYPRLPYPALHAGT